MQRRSQPARHAKTRMQRRRQLLRLVALGAHIKVGLDGDLERVAEGVGAVDQGGAGRVAREEGGIGADDEVEDGAWVGEELPLGGWVGRDDLGGNDHSEYISTTFMLF